MIKDSSKVSYYINNTFYSEIIEGLKDWNFEGGKVSSETCREIEQFLFRESRLIDEGKMEAWVDLFSTECLYWVPITPGGGNPLKEVSHAFDDRRRLEDRIFRLRTGYAYSQIPASRTLRMLSNIEAWQGRGEDELRVRVNFMLTEFRAGKQKLYSGWNGYRLKKEDGEWKIAVKQVNLIDSDQGHENMTFIL